MGTRNPIGGPFHRRVRRPFGRLGGVRRPVRWIEGNSSHGIEPLPAVSSFPLSPSIDVSLWPAAGGTELIFGDDDLDWMDANEATIERVVGQVSVLGAQLIFGPADMHATALYRLGMLVVQEVEDIAAWVPPSLWDREALEEYEWTWMYQGELSFFHPGGQVEDTRYFARDHVDIDSHIKRKLGKKDHLVLLGQFGLTSALVSDLVLGASHQLRVLFKTK